MWVKDPARLQAAINWRLGSKGWNWWCKTLLFQGCITGRRITQVFGQSLIDKMIFDECTKEIADNPRTICKPDYTHICGTLLKFNPSVVITFGKIAEEAVKVVCQASEFHKIKLIHCVHPACRKSNTLHQMHIAFVKIRKIISP
jgi:hypothetical protein